MTKELQPMSTTTSPTIPYEMQIEPQSNRMCGAASLSMVYHSFGKAVSQAEIWPRISKQNSLGSLASASYLMAQDALSRGFAALAIRAKHPLQALLVCRDKGIRAVLNHRLKEDAPTGHYTVMVDIDGESVVLHDPYFGPSRRITNAALLELWRPVYTNAEITGNVLIGIAAQSIAMPPCQLCGTPMPSSIKCAACDKVILLQPAALLGCVGESCANRMWSYICCPFCDYTWSFGAEPGKARAASGSEEKLWNLDRLFGALDKFSEHIRSLPEVAQRTDIQQQLDFIAASKGKLRLAHSEEIVRRKERDTWLAQLRQKSKQDEDAFQKSKEQMDKPGSPLDGNALGQALLKDLGLLS
jgi:hypothetical protein